MPDYIYAPKCSNVTTEGAILFTTLIQVTPGSSITLDHRVGYTSNQQFSIKVGCHKSLGPAGRTYHTWVFGSTSPCVGCNVKVVNANGVVLFEIPDIMAAYEDGYYARVEYAVEPLTGAVINVTVFDTIQEVFDAFGFEPPPGPDSGLVVTAIASPSSEPPSTDGVIVTAIARLADPNSQGGTSTTGGGQGTFDDTSDHVPVPLVPTLSATATGLVSLFRPTVAQLGQLSEYLWTNLTDFIENLNKIFVNPMDYLIALSIVPCTPDVGTERAIKIGSFTSTISMPPVISQWHEHNCGTIRISEYWGAAFDYSPYTKISLFLPFIGSVQLDPDEVMNHTIGLRYRIDLLSGQCAAIVTVDDDAYYQYTGQCAVSLPLTGSDWSRIYSAAIGAIGTVATGLAAGAAAAPIVGGKAATEIAGGAASIPGGKEPVTFPNQIMRNGHRVVSLAKDNGHSMQSAATAPVRSSLGLSAGRLAGVVDNSVGQVMSGKLAIQHTGTISGSGGMLGVRTAYLLIEYPNQSFPDNYSHMFGYPSNIHVSLGSLTGYTEVEAINISIPGTDGELAELIDALKGGVYL